MIGSKHFSGLSRAVRSATQSVVLCETLETRSLFSTSVALDPAFHGGIVQTSFGGTGEEGAYTVIVLNDGRALVGGYSHQSDGDDSVLAAYNKDGSLSTAFDGDGKLILSAAITAKLGGGLSSLMQTPDGGILLAGPTSVLKLKLNGSIDTSYGQSGYASLLPAHDSTGYDYRIDSMQLSDGTFREIAYDNAGTLRIQDLSAAGKVTRSLSKNITLSDTVTTIDVDATGITVLASRDGTLNKVYRYNFDLAPVTSFGTNGVVDLLPAFNAWANTKTPWTYAYGDPAPGIPTDLGIGAIYDAKSGIGVTGRVGEVSSKTTTTNPLGLGDPYTQIDFSISADGKTISVDSGPVKGTLLAKTTYAAYPGTGEDGDAFAGTFTTTDGQTIDFNADPNEGAYNSSSDIVAASSDGGFFVVGTASTYGNLDHNGFLVTHTAPLAAAAKTATIIGTVYNDDNGDRYFQPDVESLNVGKTVFIDTNNNGKLDTGEKSTITDQFGRYQFSNVTPGTYHIRRVLPSGYQITTPANTVTAAYGQIGRVDIGSTARGLVIATVKLDGQPTYATVYVDANRNGKFDDGEAYFSATDNGVFQFALLAGSYRIGITPLDGTTAASGSSLFYDVTVKTAGQTAIAFNLTKPSNGLINGVVYNDDNANQTQDNAETPAAGITVFLDANHNGKFDSGERTSVTNASGQYSFTNVTTGWYYVLPVLPSGYQETSAPLNQITVDTSGSSTTFNFGITNRAIVDGTVFIQNAANQTPVPITGTQLFVDLNKNGKLDTGEPSTVTGQDFYAGNGGYHFALPAGSYRIYSQTPGGTQPVSNPTGYADVTVVAGQLLNVSWHFADNGAYPGQITGTLFNDDNFDQKLDNGEVVNGNRVVFIDANHNGKLDAGEKSTTTDANGKYTFANLAAGTYDIKRVLPSSDYRITTSTSPVNLAAGQTVVFNIGSTSKKA